MFGLSFRDQLDGPVGEEFESLTSQLTSFLDVSHNDDGTLKTTGTVSGTAPVGCLIMWAGGDPPMGWLKCNGEPVSRITYKGLFDVISTTYGAGDGVLSFNLPDLQQRFPVGSKSGFLKGAAGGNFDHTHTGPSHTHGLGSGSTASAGSHSHGGSTGNESAHTHGAGSLNLPAFQTSVTGLTPPTAFTTYDNTINNGLAGSTGSGSAHSHSISADGSHTHSLSGTTDAGGTGATGTANPPYLVVDFIIYTGV
jgi:microcystin-dependent protein